MGRGMGGILKIMGAENGTVSRKKKSMMSVETGDRKQGNQQEKMGELLTLKSVSMKENDENALWRERAGY